MKPALSPEPPPAGLPRWFEAVLAVVLLALLTPALLVLAGWVWATSGRPVLFRQQRAGRYGTPFTILKFRTMRPDGTGLSSFNECRITSAGKRLRRWRLDELPQLWNILRGDMSFVGPRPELPGYVERFPLQYQRLLQVRPGLTDPATLAWRNEAEFLAQHSDAERAYCELVMPQKLALSLAYLERRSGTADFKVLVQTICLLLASSR